MRGVFFFVFFEKMRSEGKALHRRMEEEKNDLAREADLAESGERLQGVIGSNGIGSAREEFQER